MDISTPAIPDSYDDFRTRVRAYIAEHAPSLRGNRGPETAEEASAVRSFLQRMRGEGFSPPGLHSVAGPTEDDLLRRRVVAEELAMAGAPYTMGNQTGVYALSQFGTDAQKQYYLPRAASLEDVWCQLFSEPDAGSDLASLRTVARRDGDTFVITGSKIWSSYAQFADLGFLLARTDPQAEKHAGITAFIFPMDTNGVTIAPLRQMTGDFEFNEVFFDDSIIPAANMIGNEGEGWQVARTSLTNERAGVGGVSGDLRRRVQPTKQLADLSHKVTIAGVPGHQHHGVQRDIAELHGRARIVEWIGYLLATKADQGTMSAGDAPTAKVLNSELALATHEYGVSLYGPDALCCDPDLLPELWRWQDTFLYARANTIGGGTNEINRNLVAERGLGLPR